MLRTLYFCSMEKNRIFIEGEIGNYKNNAEKNRLFEMPQNGLDVFIDSPGGDVFDGMAMAALLRTHTARYNAEVRTIGIGKVASISTMVLLAGSKVEMDRNAFLMIHNPSVAYFSGDAKEMRQTAATLDTVKTVLADAYVEKIEKNGKLMDGDKQKTKNTVLQYMAAETWFSAQEALDFGLIDAIADYADERTAMQDIAAQRPQAMQIEVTRMLAQCKNLPKQFTNLITEPPMENNVTPQEKTFLQKLMAFFSPKNEAEAVEAPIAEVPAAPVAPIEPVAPVATVEETPEQLAEKLAALGYKVEKPEAIEAKFQAMETQLKAVQEELAKKNAQTVITPTVKAEVKADKTSPLFKTVLAKLQSQNNK
jgi:ATP-dependent protease ClpP protease subunit